MSSEPESSKSLVRVVLPLMAKHCVPITPENYAVWYAYAAGENSALLGPSMP